MMASYYKGEESRVSINIQDDTYVTYIFSAQGGLEIRISWDSSLHLQGNNKADCHIQVLKGVTYLAFELVGQDG